MTTHHLQNPSFIHKILSEDQQELPLPYLWYHHYYDEKIPEYNVWIHTLQGYNSPVGFRHNGENLLLSIGWTKIMKDLSIRECDILCFTALDKANYELLIYGPNMCPKNFFDEAKEGGLKTKIQHNVMKSEPYRKFPSFINYLDNHEDPTMILSKQWLTAFDGRSKPENHLFIKFQNWYKKRCTIFVVEDELVICIGWEELVKALNLDSGDCMIFYAIDEFNLQMMFYGKDGAQKKCVLRNMLDNIDEPANWHKKLLTCSNISSNDNSVQANQNAPTSVQIIKIEDTSDDSNSDREVLKSCHKKMKKMHVGECSKSARINVNRNHPSSYHFKICIPKGNTLRLPKLLIHLCGLRSGIRVRVLNRRGYEWTWLLKKECSKPKPNLCVSSGFPLFREENGLNYRDQAHFSYTPQQRCFRLLGANNP